MKEVRMIRMTVPGLCLCALVSCAGAPAAKPAAAAGAQPKQAAAQTTVTKERSLDSIVPGPLTEGLRAATTEVELQPGVGLRAFAMPGNPVSVLRVSLPVEGDPLMDALMLARTAIALESGSDAPVKPGYSATGTRVAWGVDGSGSWLELAAPTARLAGLAGVLGAALAAPSADGRSFARARAEVLARLADADAGAKLRYRTLAAALAGTPAGVGFAALADERAFAERLALVVPEEADAYRISRVRAASFALAGAAAADQVASALRASLSAILNAAAPNAAPAAPAFVPGTNVPGTDDTAGVATPRAVYVALPAPRAESLDAALFRIVLAALEDELFARLREREGLCYSVDVEYEPGVYAAVIVRGANDAAKVAAIVTETLAGFASAQVPRLSDPESFAAYRDSALTGAWSAFSAPSSAARVLGDDAVRLVEALAAASAADARGAARRCVDPKRCRIGVAPELR